MAAAAAAESAGRSGERALRAARPAARPEVHVRRVDRARDGAGRERPALPAAAPAERVVGTAADVRRAAAAASGAVGEEPLRGARPLRGSAPAVERTLTLRAAGRPGARRERRAAAAEAP